LPGRGFDQFLAAVADVHAPQAREGVEQFVAVGIGQPCTPARGEHGRATLLVGAPRRHRVDQVRTVDGIKRGELGQIGELGHGEVRSCGSAMGAQ